MVNDLFPDNKDSLALWKNGCELSEAWFVCATDEEKRRYQTTNSDQKRAFLRYDMHLELLGRLAEGELTACGFLAGSSPNSGPVLIPSFCFPRSGSDPVTVDQERSCLVSVGVTYERIRVSRVVVPDQLSNETPNTSVAKRMGRPAVGNILKEVVSMLAQEGLLVGRSRKEQEDIVRAKAREQHPQLFPRSSQPSRPKILEALKLLNL